MKWLNEIGSGWHSIATSTINELEALGAQITTVKEKFGGLRIYCHAYGGNSYEKISEITSRAENQSLMICEECGKPGHRKNIGGWVKTRCDKC